MRKTKFILLLLAAAGLSLAVSCKKENSEEIAQIELEEKNTAIQKADEEIKAAEAELEKIQQEVRQAKEEGDIEKARQLRKDMEEDVRKLKQKIIENEDRIREAASAQPAVIQQGASATKEKVDNSAVRLKEAPTLK